MDTRLSKSDVLRILHERFPKFLLMNHAGSLRGETPNELLGRYVASVMGDLHGETSDDKANLGRVAHGLEVGSETLECAARRLREG